MGRQCRRRSVLKPIGVVTMSFHRNISLTYQERIMRMLMTVKMPHAEFNSALKAGTASQKMGQIMEALKPETAYFTSIDGHRTALLVVDLADPSQIPALAEPWFLSFNADVDFRPVMTPDDLKQAGLDAICKQWG
jgi:hypothetical protein